MKDKIYIITIIALITALLFSIKSCNSSQVSEQLALQNIEALKDSTRKTKNLLGQLQYEKTSFMGELNTLKKLNADLVKEAQSQNGNTRVITKIVTKVVFDTIIIENKVNRVDDSTFVIDFNYKKDFDTSNAMSFNGTIPAQVKTIGEGLSLESSVTTISNIDMKMKLYTGISEDNGIYRIFARTDFPGVAFDLDGAIIDPEKSFVLKKQENFSVILGAGLGYGATDSGLGFFPSIGLYVGLNLIKF